MIQYPGHEAKAPGSLKESLQTRVQWPHNSKPTEIWSPWHDAVQNKFLFLAGKRDEGHKPSLTSLKSQASQSGSDGKLHGSDPTNTCKRKYVDQKVSIAMQATKRSAGVVLEVNLRNPLHISDKTCKCGIHPGFETLRPKQGYQWPHKKDLCSPMLF